jgi:hypothetical protein
VAKQHFGKTDARYWKHRVLVRFNHVARFIVNADHGIM